MNVVTAHLCPLRERASDIPLLIDHFLTKYRRQLGRELIGFTDAAKEILCRYDWPGNVRQLENVVERSVVLARGRYADVDLFPPEMALAKADSPDEDLGYTPRSLKEALEEPERRIIQRALLANNWNRQATSVVLEINRTTLYKKMKRYGLEAETVRV